MMCLISYKIHTPVNTLKYLPTHWPTHLQTVQPIPALQSSPSQVLPPRQVSTTSQVSFPGGNGSVETTFSSGITTDVKNNNVALGVSFTSGLASPEINKGSGDLLYVDNRAKITRDLRQKEDIKIILEF